MMIIAKCPLRVSLVGGSTDLQSFIDKYGQGSVINFPSTLYTYITVHDNNENKYIINYSRKEVTEKAQDIHNDVAREALVHFKTRPVTVTFNTDILSEGSGLASSSSYTIAITKALAMYNGINISDFEICRIALDLERKFNPLTGYQDSYGSGIGGFKRIDFHKDRRPLFRYLDVGFFEEKYDIFLIYTGIKRSSTSVLQSVDIDKSRALLPLVDETEKAIESRDYKTFEKHFNEGWKRKKETSDLIASDAKIKQMDDIFTKSPIIRAVKLCGAGGGGYFLILCDKGMDTDIQQSFKTLGKIIKIRVNASGVRGIEV